MLEQEARDPLPPISSTSQEGEFSALRPVSGLDGVAPTAKQGLDTVSLRRHHQRRHFTEIDFGELRELGI
jgi:hypothetical protein